jgi:hypothetical protein
MKNNFDIDAYLRQAEAQFSGFDGDNFDGDNFDGESNFSSNIGMDLGFDGNDGFDGDSNASGGGNYKQPSPYQVSITNSTPNPLLCTLFGMNQFLLTPNFGSAVGITVIPSQSNVTYLELLQQSSSQPFETSLLRIQSVNTAQITNIITITSKDANGQLCQIPLITQSYFSANQFQSGILDIPFALRIDGNTNLQFNVLGNTTVIMTFFPRDKANLSRNLNKQGALQQYSFPSVPVAAMPVYVTPKTMRRGSGTVRPTRLPSGA